MISAAPPKRARRAQRAAITSDPGLVIFEDSAIERTALRGMAGQSRLGREAEGQFTLKEPYQPFVPAPTLVHQLMYGQGIEELVGDQDQGRPAPWRILVPAGLWPVSALACASRRVGLVSTKWTSTAWRRAGTTFEGAQRSAISVPRPGPSSISLIGSGAAQASPAIGAPQAQDLAEHLADLGRGGEVAGGPQRIARPVIAVAGMAEGERHVAAHADRPVLTDQGLDLTGERRVVHAVCGLRRKALRINTRPIRAMGRE